jgi:hypothetical protein
LFINVFPELCRFDVDSILMRYWYNIDTILIQYWYNNDTILI